MGIVQKDAFRTMIISYLGIGLGYINKGLLFLLILSTEEIGLINLLLSVALLFSRFSSLGASYTTWKFLPYFKNEEKRHNGFLPFILLISLLGLILFAFLYWVFSSKIESWYVHRSAEFIKYYYWIIPMAIGIVIFWALEAFLKAFYKNTISVFANDVALRLSLTILLGLYFLKLIDFHEFIIYHSIIHFVPALILLVYLNRINELNLKLSSIRISRRFRKILFEYTTVSYLNSLGSVLVTSLDVIMIASLLGLEATGVYATVVFLTSALQVPYRSILRISGPLVAEHWKHRELGKMQELYTKVSSTGLLIGLSLFIFIWLNIDFAFSFLKPEFQPGIWVFFFLMMGRLLDMFFGINGSIFSTSKKYKYDLIFTVFLIIIVYSLNLLFIPKWGMVGAAISTGIALIVYNLGRIIFVWKILKMHPFTKNQFLIIGIGIATLFIGQYVGDLITNKWIDLVVVSFVFVITFILPILLFNLEPNMKEFLLKGLKFIKNKK